MNPYLEKMQAEVGTVHHSDWMTIDQDMINRFADVTLDHQFIHIDPARAKTSPFGGTIAHGFLSLSLLPHLRASIEPLSPPEGGTGINYGFDRIRFINPVRSGSRVRVAATLVSIDEVAPGQFQQSYDIVLEIEGQEKPALAATWLTRFII